jgi:hypothetical protein
MFTNYIAHNLMFADVMHKFVHIKDVPYFIFPILILFLVWQISKYILKGKQALITPAILLISPWFWYEVLAYSFYIFIFFLILTIIYGLFNIKEGRLVPGSIIVSFGSLACMYSSSLFLVLIPISLSIIIVSKVITLKQLRYSIFIIALLILPLIIIFVINRVSITNTLNREITVFSDPGLLNMVNRYQGAASENGYRNLARISENKYIFYMEFFVNKYLNQIMPVSIFTPQNKLLGFSFSPPIFFGFLIPFAYGFYQLMQKPLARKIIFISTLLVIPSILAKQSVSLNRLIIFSPVIIYIITYGLIIIYQFKKRKITRLLLFSTIVLVLFQLIITVTDIKLRERNRLVAYFGNVYQIPEP